MTRRTAALCLLSLSLLGSAPSPLRVDMAGHFLMSLDVMQGVTTDNLDLTRAAFGEIATDASNQGSHMDAVRDLALRGQQAENLADASRAFSELAAACGECHHQTGGGPSLDAYDSATWDEVSTLGNHAWGADLMWLSLVKQDASAWKRSLGFMTPLPRRLRRGPDKSKTSWKALQAAKERAADGPALSPESYAGVLTTCAGCHR